MKRVKFVAAFLVAAFVLASSFTNKTTTKWYGIMSKTQTAVYNDGAGNIFDEYQLVDEADPTSFACGSSRTLACDFELDQNNFLVKANPVPADYAAKNVIEVQSGLVDGLQRKIRVKVARTSGVSLGIISTGTTSKVFTYVP